ncbi:hypothetical protein [Pseudooceanicola nanhaiensis]|uniref:DUF7282 domain-containing protein n=1 Tax=Pseudooceanicola nanhaiensis TaxID=375761 RepID=UPI001CD5B773|nr:hypothetical protein [Pseudooceanicola nanhaiensis]MCA0919055.1 hypothetical protein [Pseudooceanicola nanhaiensis]
MKTLALAAALTTAVAGAASAAETAGIDVTGATFTPGEITFPEVTIDQPGYLVVHEIVDGKPVVPESVGHMLIEEGTTDNVTVPIEGGVKNGADYIAMLHYETNGNTTYDFKGGDTLEDGPVTAASGEPVAQPFKTQM